METLLLLPKEIFCMLFCAPEVGLIFAEKRSRIGYDLQRNLWIHWTGLSALRLKLVLMRS